MKMWEAMISVIFTLKKSFIKHFGFEKKVYSTSVWQCYVKYLTIFFYEAELLIYENY